MSRWKLQNQAIMIFFTISGDGTVLWKQGERVISAGAIQVNFDKDLRFQQNWIFPPKINLHFAIWTETMTTKGLTVVAFM